MLKNTNTGTQSTMNRPGGLTLPFPFSEETIAELGLLEPATRAKMDKQKISDASFSQMPHRALARLIRWFISPTSAQDEIEATATLLEGAFGPWWACYIAEHCYLLKREEAGLSNETWCRVEWELAWRIGCTAPRVPRKSDLTRAI